MKGIEALNKLAQAGRLETSIKLVSRNSEYYILSQELADYYGIEKKVKRTKVDLSIWDNIIYVDTAGDTLMDLDIFSS